MRLAAGISLFLLAACAVQPPYQRPAVELPAAWQQSAPRFAEDGRWWRIYQDGELETRR
jgi:outer membrane protein TolC